MKIAVVQLTSELDYKETSKKFEVFFFEAQAGAEAAFLPECFLSLSNGLEPSPYLVDLDQLDQCSLYGEIKSLAVDP